jgi:hypothetical protein
MLHLEFKRVTKRALGVKAMRKIEGRKRRKERWTRGRRSIGGAGIGGAGLEQRVARNIVDRLFINFECYL